jgi:hypothetical protein
MGQLGEGRPQDLVTLAGLARALFAGTFRAAWRHGELNQAFAGRMRPDQRKEQRGDRHQEVQSDQQDPAKYESHMACPFCGGLGERYLPLTPAAQRFTSRPSHGLGRAV